MLFDWLDSVRRWLSRKTRSTRGKGRRRAKGTYASSYRVWFELLEDRFAPATAYTWTGLGGNSYWNTAGNWNVGTNYPGFATGDTAIFPSGVTSQTVTINAAIANPVGNVSFTGGGYIINGSSGNALLLGNATALGNLTATASETINANVTLGSSNQTWNVSTGNTLTIAGAVTTGGNITVGNSTATGMISITGNVTFGSSQDWTVANSTIFSITGIVGNSAAGNLTIGNSTTGYAGTLVLGGCNTFGGGLTINGNGATVQATANGALGNASSGNVTLNANNTTLQLNTGTGVSASFPYTVDIPSATANNTTIENVSGNNTWATLDQNANADTYNWLPDAGTLTFTTFNAQNGGYARVFNFGNSTSAGNISLSGNSSALGSTQWTLNKNGPGTLTIGGGFYCSGLTTTITGGALVVNGSAGFGTGTTGSFNAASNFTLGNSTSSGTLIIGTFTGNTTPVVNGTITGNGSVIYNGNSTSTLTLGNSTSTYTGNTTINAGTLKIAADSDLGNVTAGNTGDLVFGGGNLSLSTAGLTIVQPIIINACGTVSTNAFTSSGGINIEMNSGASTAGALTLTSGLTLGAGNTTAFTLNAVTGTGSGKQAINVSGGTFTVNATNAISLSEGSSFGGAGTYELFRYTGTAPTFSNFSNPTGQLTGGSGIFNYTLVNNTGNDEIDLVVVNGNMLTWTGGNDSHDHNWDDPSNWTVTSGSDTYPKAGDTANFSTGDTVNVDGAQAVGTINFNTGASITINQTNSGTLNLGGSITAATSDTIAAPLALTASDTVTASTGSILTISGNITGSSFGLTANGTGTLTLAGASNTFSGGVTVSSGTVQAGSASAFGSGVLTVNGGTVDLNGQGVTVAGITGMAGTIASSTTPSTLTLTPGSGKVTRA